MALQLLYITTQLTKKGLEKIYNSTPCAKTKKNYLALTFAASGVAKEAATEADQTQHQQHNFFTEAKQLEEISQEDITSNAGINVVSSSYNFHLFLLHLIVLEVLQV